MVKCLSNSLEHCTTDKPLLCGRTPGRRRQGVAAVEINGTWQMCASRRAYVKCVFVMPLTSSQLLCEYLILTATEMGAERAEVQN